MVSLPLARIDSQVCRYFELFFFSLFHQGLWRITSLPPSGSFSSCVLYANSEHGSPLTNKSEHHHDVSKPTRSRENPPSKVHWLTFQMYWPKLLAYYWSFNLSLFLYNSLIMSLLLRVALGWSWLWHPDSRHPERSYTQHHSGGDSSCPVHSQTGQCTMIMSGPYRISLHSLCQINIKYNRKRTQFKWLAYTSCMGFFWLSPKTEITWNIPGSVRILR